MSRPSAFPGEPLHRQHLRLPLRVWRAIQTAAKRAQTSPAGAIALAFGEPAAKLPRHEREAAAIQHLVSRLATKKDA